MKFIVIDTETTGLFRYDRRADQDGQPRMVEIAAVLLDLESRKELARYESLVKPDGWQIPNDAQATHGITDDLAMAEGKPIIRVLDEFDGAFFRACDFVVAFSVDYDLKMLRAERRRAKREDMYGERDKFDVMRPLTPFAKVPPTKAMLAKGRKGFKQPSLIEAAKIILGREHAGAHRAMADVAITTDLFWFLWDKGLRPKADSKEDGAKPLLIYPPAAGELEQAAAGASSKGRTPDFGSGNAGSSTAAPAIPHDDDPGKLF